MATTKFLPIICGVTIFLLASLFVTVESSVSRRGLGVTRVAIIAQYLTAHNKVRARHNLPRLKWSNALANYAKWYANQRRGDCKLIHSNLNYGENMFWGKGNRWKPSDAVTGWAIQESYYNYKSNTCMPNKECLHYTQIVWKTTTKVGCAQIRCRTGDTLMVCEYDPHGNVVGQRPY